MIKFLTRTERAASSLNSSERTIEWLSIFLFFLIFSGCATVQPPTGGEPDEIPPKIDTLKSTPNFQTNFQKQRIELKFDEWIKLNDVFNQVVVSPPLAPKDYEVTLKGKTVRFDFSDEVALRENATYTINFGEAIQDLTKGNKAEDIRFVFSTGAVIDSLEVTGKIIDAFSGEPIEKALFMLYDNLHDSVVKTEFPLYFAQTDESGRFKIQNVRPGTFKGFALSEEGGKYKYDQPSEKIGFPDELVVVSDSTRAHLDIEIFKETPAFKLKDDETGTYGFVKLVFSQSPENLELSYDTINQKIYQLNQGDSIQLWYDLDSARTWKMYLKKDTFFTDTVKIRSKSKVDFLEANPFGPSSGVRSKLRSKRKKKKSEKKKKATALPPIKQNPTKSIILNFTHPIARLDASKIKLSEDTSRIEVRPEVFRDSSDFRNLIIQFNWKELKNHELILLPEALTGWYGTQNDTIVQPINVSERKSYGTILLSVNDLDNKVNYVIQVLNEKGKLVQEFFHTEKESFKTDLKYLNVGEYAIRIIEDSNRNGRWDPGDYESKKQAERTFLKKIEKLRANWDVEVKISGNNFSKSHTEEEHSEKEEKN